MTRRELIGARILAQGLAGPAADITPAQVAHEGVAHQGQDLPGVISSLALRSGGATGPVLEAFDRGEIVRGYPMRGTVFVVGAGTLRWLTELCAAGPVRQAIARRASLGLDEAQVRSALEVLAALTAGASERGSGRGVLRQEVMDAWDRAGIDPGGGRGYHLLTHALSVGQVAYGPWRGQETAVVDAADWLPAGSGLEGTFGGDRVAAVAELARRYLRSHGPARERDLAWWSKLTLGEIRAALPRVAEDLETGYADARGRLHARAEEARGGDGERLWWRPGLAEDYARHRADTMTELLLPGFDELVLGYRDRLDLMDEATHRDLVPGNNGVFRRAALRRGEVTGFWKAAGRPGRRRLDLAVTAQLSAPQRERFERLFAAFPVLAP